MPSIPREHVGPHIYKRPERFRCYNLEAPQKLNYPDIHLEVDTLEDYEVVCQIYEHFLPKQPEFSLEDAIQYAVETGIWRKNAEIPRRWQSYRAD
jgi:spore coat polysaccharide biosynthesis protein SpsF (cytidylyltransferase family)